MKKKVAILGAGPAGLTAGYILSKNNFDVEIFESAPTVGGMCKTIDLWGYRVDMGPHRFFSKDPRINKLWLEIIGDDYLLVNRSTRIFYKNKFFNYPINVFNALKGLGIFESILITFSYLKSKFFPRPDVTFEDFVINIFGERLYKIFFKTYSERLWGIKCTELDSEWPKQRIKKFSFYQAVVNSIFKSKSAGHKTLVDVFPYPKNGTGEVYERMAKKVIDNGGKVHVSTPIEQLVFNEKTATGIKVNGEIKNFDLVISTIPLTKLADSFSTISNETKQAFNSLRFRNTVLVYHEIDDANLFKDQWLYIHDPGLVMLRVTNFKNWSPDLYGGKNGSVLVTEYSCWDNDVIWKMTDDELVKMSQEDLKKLIFMRNKKILNTKPIKLFKSYPVYDVGYKEKVKVIKEFLKDYKNLFPIGRGGSFKYNNQDHSILMGLLTAENIMGVANHDTWEVNEDTEYQESSVITEDGLKIID